MDCLLPLIAGFCMAQPASVTLRADAHYQVSSSDFAFIDGHRYGGAFGRIELSVASDELAGFRFRAFAGHFSFIDTNRDTGYEYVGAGLEWRPFK